MPTRGGVQQAERALVNACTSGSDVATMQRDVLRALRRLMTVDAAFFATADPENLVFTGAAAEEPLDRASRQFLDNEFGGGDVNRFAVLARSPVPVSSLDAATRSDRWASPRYREIMRPLGLGDELRAALVAGRTAGATCACTARTPDRASHRPRWRSWPGSPPTSPTACAPPSCSRVRTSEPERRAGRRRAHRRLGRRGVTPEAEHLLTPLPRAGHDLPLAVSAVARALRSPNSRAPGRGTPTAGPTLRGGWLLISASRLRGPPDERRNSVVLAPARAADTVPLLLSAHGLTSREGEMARLVLRGASTAAIVDTLHISRYTVQDHLTAVFDKVGVRSRGDLAVRLLGR